MSAYTAYQLAQPQQSLLDNMTTRGFGPAVDPSLKKKNIMDEAQEKVEKAFKRSEKRSGKWKPVTTILDTAAGFVDPATAAILGAVSGGLSGFDRMRAFEGLKKDTKGMGKYSFMDDYMKGVKKQMSGLETDAGDVLVSAGTGALKNFAMGKASEAMAGLGKAKGVDPIDKALGAPPPAEFGMKMPEGDITGQSIKQGGKFGAPEGFDATKLKSGSADFASKGFNPKGENIAKHAQPKLDPTQATDVAKLDSNMMDATTVTDATKRVGKFKPEAADWIKKLQQGGGKDMLSNFFKEDPMGALANLTQMGQGFLTPLLNYNKPSDFRLY